MLRVFGNPRRFCDGVTRRDALTIGTLGVLGGAVSLPSMLAAEQSGRARPGKAKNVIVLYLHGGAPTQDMFDLKPEAPVDIRGEFKPIATSAAGVQICELLPRTARWMHKAAIVRTVNHRVGCHNTLASFTGSDIVHDPNELIPKETYPPGMGSVCEYLKPAHIDMPHYVALPSHLGWGYGIRRPGPNGGFLGKRYDPLCSTCNPIIDPHPPAGRRPMWLGTPLLADASFPPEVTIDRLDRRRSLLQQIDDHQRRADAGFTPTVQYDRVRQRAFSMLTGSRVKTAFDLENEDVRVRQRYGHHLFGASALVARRLIEAGVRFVDVYWDGYAGRMPTNLDPYWDTHSNNFRQLREVNLPYLDQTYDALLADLNVRGLLDETLIVMMSDMGRTPRINGNAGRDHWTSCYSVLLAGAGIRGGTLCGVSDAHAAYVRERPVRPADICATVYHCLGIDPHSFVPDRTGRPIPIANGGEPLWEILTN